MRVLIKNKFMDNITKFQINHNQKNVLNLEDTSSLDSSCGEQDSPKFRSMKDDLAQL